MWPSSEQRVRVAEPSVGPGRAREVFSQKTVQIHVLGLGIYYLTFISHLEVGNLFLDWPLKEPE